MHCPIFDIIPVFVSLLLCGMLFVFFNTRMNELKHNNDKNSKVLASLVSEFRNSINRGSPMDYTNSQNVASDIAFNTAKNICKLNSQDNIGICFATNASVQDILELKKEQIVHTGSDSDDSGDSGDSDDSDSGEGSDSDDSDDGSMTNLVKIVNMVSGSQDKDKKPLSSPIIQLPTTRDIQSADFIEEIPATNINDGVEEVVLNLTELSSADIKTSPQDLESMKVDELKTLAISKNLASPKEIKRMKKNEIVLLFRK